MTTKPSKQIIGDAYGGDLDALVFGQGSTGPVWRRLLAYLDEQHAAGQGERAESTCQACGLPWHHNGGNCGATEAKPEQAPGRLDMTACYCPDHVSAGVPCRPGTCPNVPKAAPIAEPPAPVAGEATDWLDDLLAALSDGLTLEEDGVLLGEDAGILIREAFASRHTRIRTENAELKAEREQANQWLANWHDAEYALAQANARAEALEKERDYERNYSNQTLADLCDAKRALEATKAVAQHNPALFNAATYAILGHGDWDAPASPSEPAPVAERSHGMVLTADTYVPANPETGDRARIVATVAAPVAEPGEREPGK